MFFRQEEIILIHVNCTLTLSQNKGQKIKISSRCFLNSERKLLTMSKN
jgi:hypothetical protein